MDKKLTLSFIVLLLFSNAFALASDSACSYVAGSNTWHCSNNSPGISVTPGGEGELTIYCCFTGPGASTDDIYSLHMDLIDDYSNNIQNTDLTWSLVNTEYPATIFITDVEYSNEVHPNTDIPVTWHFTLPTNHEEYGPGEVLHARADLQLDAGGAFIYNNVIDMRVVIPDNWKPSPITMFLTFVKNNYAIIGAVCVVILIAGFIVSKKKGKINLPIPEMPITPPEQ